MAHVRNPEQGAGPHGLHPAGTPHDEKRPYHPPELVRYGSLAQITQGGAFSRADGNSGFVGNRGQGGGFGGDNGGGPGSGGPGGLGRFN